MIKSGKLAVLLLVCVGLLGCNTVAGAGKDMKKVGEKVEEAARK
ncbi:MAG: entericidin A/B family lipoprotein [Lysobacteraceae bacterium]|nr:MAG: entericidin A/B family lipoprotein [Xanthomonadaceae bacterium]